MNHRAELKDSQSKTDLLTFQTKIEHLERFLELRGIPRRSPSSMVWGDFSALDAKARREILTQVSQSIDLLMSAVDSGFSVCKDKQLAWYALRFLNLAPPPTLFEQIDDRDFVEIYSADGIQIFRNLEFYQMVSYSLADMSVYPWDKLFHRENHIRDQIIQQGFVKGFSNIREPFELQIERHHVKESFSSKKWEYEVKFKILSPLFDAQKNIKAILATSSITRLDDRDAAVV